VGEARAEGDGGDGFVRGLTVTPRGFVLFGGTGNATLAAAVARELGTELGTYRLERFPDTEITVRLQEPVRGREVFVIQPTSPAVNEHLMELLIFADACRRASADRVVAIVTYFGYARSDKRSCQREPITARLVADLMQCAGIDHVILVDVHTPQTEGFFRGPVDHLSAVPELSRVLGEMLPPETVVVSPDAGRVRMATEYARRLGLPLIVLHKRRDSGTATRVTHVVGEVRGRPCLIIDDMIATGGTIAESARALVKAGARSELVVAATHGLLLDGACARMAAAGVAQVYVTDSVATPERRCSHARVVTIAPLLAAAIRLLGAAHPAA
jgi:ribose-phosphate pyrophosphokinase